MERIQQISISQLKPHPSNKKIYSKGDVEELKQSISELGILEPLVILPNKTILSGHRRYDASVQLGIKKLPVITKRVPPKDIEYHLVSYNTQRVKTATEILNEIEVVEKYVLGNKKAKGKGKREFISSKIKVPQSIIAKLLVVKKREPQLIEDIDKGILTISTAYTHTLRVERIEKHKDSIKKTTRRLRRKPIVEGKDFTLYNSSSADMSALKAGTIQTIMTSPPFFLRRTYGNKKGEIGGETEWDDFLGSLRDVFKECWRVLKPNGSMFVEMSDSSMDGSYHSLPHKFLHELLTWDKWYLQNQIIWFKANTIKQNNNRFSPCHSYIFFLTKKKKGYFFQRNAAKTNRIEEKQSTRIIRRLHGEDKWNPRRERGLSIASPYTHMGDVWLESTNIPSTELKYKEVISHPAQYPPDICQMPILTTSKEGDTILDPFSGGASTGVCALRHGRKYIGFDTNPKFNELGRRRLNEARDSK